MEEPDKHIIDEFFDGKSRWSQINTIGHYWVARHGRRLISKQDYARLSVTEPPEVHEVVGDQYVIDEFETLTFEPVSGGQYEIAVRILSEGEWRGYCADTFMHGQNTGGH